MIKLVVSDIDGTLIDSFGRVSEHTKKVIHQLKDHGIEFAFATGRNFDGTYDIAQKLGVENKDVGMICLNGLETYQLPQKTKTKRDSLTFEESKEMQLLGEKFYLGIMYCFEDCIYFQMDDLSYEDYMITMGEDVKKYHNFRVEMKYINSVDEIKDRFKKDEIQKIAYVQTPQYIDLIIDRMRDFIGEDFSFMRVGPGWTEISQTNVSKGEAVLAYAASKGIKPEEIIVFGDSENDISMFEVAGTAVAMANAMDTAKSKANDTTLSNDESGVAVYLEKLLNEKK